MKTKILIPLIILCSLLSAGVGAFIMLEVLTPNIESKINTEVVTQVKQMMPTKEKTEIIIEEKKSELLILQEDITKIVETTSPSVVSIVIKKDLVIYRSDPFGFFQQPVGSIESKVGGGTGFFITVNGMIITNKHVVSDKDAIYTIITNDNNEYDAKVLALDPVNDIAVMKLESNDTFIPLTITKNTENIKLGQFVLTIGNALSQFQNSVSLGIISGKNRSIETKNGKLAGLIQTDAAINPGNSGGPLVNLDGEVIGINTAIANNSQGIGFSISLSENKVAYMLESIEKEGRIKRPFVGIAYIPVSKGIQEKLKLSKDYGAYIINEEGSVVSGSSAERAGIEPGDVILEINAQKIDINHDLNTLIQNKIPGEEITLKTMKPSGEEKEVTLKLGEY